MADYEGMRWFKCDLQMQTPADAPHWRGKKMGGSAEEQRESADAYIRRCYEVGLEVIAITDHNYLSRDFIPLLQESIDRMTGRYGYKLVLMPGFEFEADVGKGVHVLALFEPDAKLDELDHLLTECGVQFPRHKDGVLAKSNKRLPEILDCIQKADAKGMQRGLVVMPHIMKNDGLFDNDKVSDWLQQDEFLNEDLLAVEVPKPVAQMSKNWQRLFNAGMDCEKAWRRSRPIACIMSSDAKALTQEEDSENYIGMRSTWIKMSKPSVESLRQAFLDHASRIRLQAPRPSDEEIHPRLVSIAVKGAAFLEDQTVVLSPNLNCVIGGRGSGKSSLLEYLRFCLEPAFIESVDSDLQEKLKAIHRTVEVEGAELQLTFEVSKGVLDTVLLRPSKKEHRIEGREVTDLKAVLDQLQVQFFSQSELSRLNRPGRKSQVLRLVDAACENSLSELNGKEVALGAKLEQLFTAEAKAEEVGAEVSRLKQELEELGRQWQARQEIQGDAEAHRLAGAAGEFGQSMRKRAETDMNLVRTLRVELDLVSELPPSADTWPYAEWFARVKAKLDAARTKLSADLYDALATYAGNVREAFDNEEPGWTEVDAHLKSASARFETACREKGLLPSDVSRLQEIDRQRTQKLIELEQRRKALDELRAQAIGVDEELVELHKLWRAQFEARVAASEAIEGPTTTVTTSYMLDARSFESIWERLAPRDRRPRLGKNWDDIGRALFSAFATMPAAASPWEVLVGWLKSFDTVPTDGVVLSLIGELAKHLQLEDVRPIWHKVRLTRVDDFVDVELKRPDGTSAGRMSGEGGKVLSEGQQNTALLSLILAQGRGPIVIDQPEDELDSNYIFSDLVPLLRQAKEGRQLILATHNANLPVNADAEFIYAFEAKDGRGARRTQGGLDRSDVAEAVLDIMEGSEIAFRRRSEKYNF